MKIYITDWIPCKLPPSLRERQEDIIEIFRKFVQDFSTRYDSVFKGFSDEARELLVSYRWPGNIRELRNVAEQLVVLEKSQFIDAERLQKYLKGRQHEGSPDNLPMVSDSETRNEPRYDEGFNRRDRELIYRALVELSNDIGDVKKMLSTFLYSSFSNASSKLPALPEISTSGLDSATEQLIKYNPDIDTPLGMRSIPNQEVETEPQVIEETTEIEEFFSNDEIPSIEETEQFLIKKALEKYDGNRRKASEALGISERTLYRKLDQYGLA